ncbi:MAG: tetratricopeptide repeat protein [Acidobacteria bacterium]|nr:tetratricopeptide repeat protein [Acidobacteriota bacterium]MBV9622689.1 tetratricopeptide repeat protein [Acidobacteriota bacterium]
MRLLLLIPAALLLLATALYVSAAAQAGDSGQPGPAAVPDRGQLAETLANYKHFLESPPAGTPVSALVEARVRLATVYCIEHRYVDSLNTLRPLQAERRQFPAQAWTVKGLDEIELNQLAAAIVSLRRAIMANPRSTTARLALGDALARSGRMEDAGKQYERQAELTPDLPDAWYKLGLAHSEMSAAFPHAQLRASEQDVLQQLIAEELIAKGDNLNAARMLFRLIRESRERQELHAELGTALLALGYTKAAGEHFRQELLRNPESPSARLGLAEIAALSSNWREVSNMIDALARSQPVELTRLLQVPPVGLVLDRWNGGRIKPPQSFIASPTGTLWGTWLSGSGIIGHINYNEAARSHESCGFATALPGSWLSQDCYQELETRLKHRKMLTPSQERKLAEAEFRLGHYQAALHTATLLHEADPRGGWGIYWLSRAHGALAEECFLKVGALNPNSARVHQMLAEHYMKLWDYPKAKTEYEKALRLTPDLPELHLGLGTVLSRTGELDQSETELKRTLELAPQSAFAHYQLGHLYLQESRWDAAIEQLKQVSVDSSELLSARLDQAQAESETGETLEAIQDLRSVAELDHDGEVYFRLAPLYRKLGDEGRAREALATFKQLRASSLDADKNELGALEREQTVGSPP